ncbi:MAG: acyloxyacyl hydrolase [Verrucomicrobiales bacterium]|jgi:opacity protein-like surface antigen|nr:acyloxyacyl hydrolase [Verrucomicrobiales bacterium]
MYKLMLSPLAGALLLGAAVLFISGPARASAELDKVVASPKTRCDAAKDWSLELGSGVAFSNIRAPHLDGYTYIPVKLTASLKVDEVDLDDFAGGIFRGQTEFFFRGYWNQIINGPEHRIVGATFGPRYNFVQPGWKLVPFIETSVGFGFIDSNQTHGPLSHDDHLRGMGEDFNFTFSVAVGARYDLDETWFMRVSVSYQHFSNAGLSEPERSNRAIDAVGPELAFGANF